MRLSETDIKLLRLLQQDCRQSTKAIAKELGIPITTTYDKTKRMKKEGIIKDYRAILDQGKLGLPTTTFVMVSVEYPDCEFSQVDVAKRIAAFPEVTEVFIMAGDWDLILKVKARSIEDVGEFVIDRLRKVDGVKKTKSISVFRKIKESPVIPV